MDILFVCAPGAKFLLSEWNLAIDSFLEDYYAAKLLSAYIMQKLTQSSENIIPPKSNSEAFRCFGKRLSATQETPAIYFGEKYCLRRRAFIGMTIY